MRPSTGVLILALFCEVFMVRQVNAAAMSIADASEGCFLTAYRDPAGVVTAGYGHVGPDVKLGQTYTKEQALAWRAADMARAAAFVEAHVKVPLTDNEFSALSELTFNIGVGNFLGSTLLRLLNRSKYSAFPAQIMRWTKAGGKVLPGLVARREKEVALWNLSPVHPNPVAVVASVSPAQPPGVPTAKPTAPTLLERIRAWFNRNPPEPTQAPA